jgi:hypothetical protein
VPKAESVTSRETDLIGKSKVCRDISLESSKTSRLIATFPGYVKVVKSGLSTYQRIMRRLDIRG